MTTRRGCDLAFGVVPGHERALARALKAGGFTFVVRYLSHDPAKNLSHAEVTAYRAEGIAIVTVWESTGTTALGGAVAGKADATAAKELLEQLGAPAHAPVYFAVDFAIGEGQMPLLDDYLDATAYVLTEAENGVYGSYLAAGAKHVRYRWQTYAWSAGRWEPGDQLRQVLNTAGTADGVSYDADLAEDADFGQWRWPAPVHKAVKPKKKIVRKAVKKVAAPVKRTVAKEPVLTAASLNSVAAAAVAWWIPHAGVTWTADQKSAAITIVTAVCSMAAALYTRPARMSAFTAAFSTAAVAAGAFGLHLPAAWIAGELPVISVVVAGLLRAQVSPTAAAQDT